MIALYILLGILALLAVILFTPVCVTTRYESGQPLRMNVRILGVPIRLLPTKEKPGQPEAAPEQQPPQAEQQKKKKEKKPKESPLAELQKAFKKDGLSGTIRYLKQFAGMAKKAGGRLRRSVTITRLWLMVRLGCDEADETAVNYGRLCTAIYPAVYALTELFRSRSRRVELSPDFRREDTVIDLDVRVHILPARVLWAAICLFCSFVAVMVRDKIKVQQTGKNHIVGGTQHGENGA